MVLEDYAENVVIVDLLPLPEAVNELGVVIEIVCNRRGSDVVIDLSRVDVISSRCVSHLLALRAQLTLSGRRLILCGVCGPVRRVFEVTGLDEVIEFVPDKSAALKRLEPSPSTS